MSEVRMAVQNLHRYLMLRSDLLALALTNTRDSLGAASNVPSLADHPLHFMTGNFKALCFLIDTKVGLTRFHPTSRDKSDKMCDKQKVLNNFPTTLFIKNWLSSKCI